LDSPSKRKKLEASLSCLHLAAPVPAVHRPAFGAGLAQAGTGGSRKNSNLCSFRRALKRASESATLSCNCFDPKCSHIHPHHTGEKVSRILKTFSHAQYRLQPDPWKNNKDRQRLRRYPQAWFARNGAII
jgi:hypothetical protein